MGSDVWLGIEKKNRNLSFSKNILDKVKSYIKTLMHGRIDCMQGYEVINFFSSSTQLSMKFHLLIKTKIPTNKEVFYFVFNMLINVKMPTIVGILIFMSRMNFMLS